LEKTSKIIKSWWTSRPCLYLIGARAEDEQVKGDGGDHVNEEPSLEVVDGDLARVAHHLIVDVDIGGTEVDDNVHDEHDVHNEVNDVEWVTGVAAVPVLLLHLLLVEQEGS